MAATVGLAWCITAATQAQSPAPVVDFGLLDLEQLAQIKIVSVSRTEVPFRDTPAAVMVLTGRDLERSGVTNVPDALRLAPGTDIAQLTASSWSVSIRGFTGEQANQLLVLLDGRSLYNPIFAGTNWEALNVQFADTEQIEVVRGPGASAWGSNAVNGVINIVTKSAHHTLGGRLELAAGDHGRRSAAARYGFELSPTAAVRVYGSRTESAASRTRTGADGEDAWDSHNAGLRADWDVSAGTTLQLSAEHFAAKMARTQSLADLGSATGSTLSRVPQWREGSFVLGQLQHRTVEGKEFRLQASWERSASETIFTAGWIEQLNLEAQGTFVATDHHRITGGGAVNRSRGWQNPARLLRFYEASESTQLLSAFVQDEVALEPGRWTALLGARLEHHDYLDWEFQPTARVLFHPDRRHTLWVAVSRAVRRPNQADRALLYDSAVIPAGVNGPLPVLVQAQGNPNVRPVGMKNAELGWRLQAGARFAIDAAVFASRYTDLINGLPDPSAARPEFTPAPLHVLLPATLVNSFDATSHGAELALTWNATPTWRWRANYTYLAVRTTALTPLASTVRSDGDFPRHQVALRSSLDLGRNWELDSTVRIADRLPYFHVPGYADLDLRIAWQPRPNLELSLVGQNLLHGHRFEMPSAVPGYTPRDVARTGYGKVTWRF